MKSLRFFASILPAGLLVLSCGTPGAEPQETREESFFPMQTGLELTFKVTGTYENGRVDTHESRMVWTRTEKVNGIECHAMEQYARGNYLWTTYWAWDREGLKVHRRNQTLNNVYHDDVFVAPNAYLKLPFKKGETWSWEGKQIGKKHREVHRCDGEDILETPFGRFECIRMYDEIHVEVDGKWVRTIWGTHWYARGVGLVKVDFHMIDPYEQKIHILVELKERKIVPPEAPLKKEVVPLPPNGWIGIRAPEFSLQDGEGNRVTLDSYLGKKPVVLIFGNYTSPDFAKAAPAIGRVYEKHKNDAAFFWIYTQESNPSDAPKPRQDVPAVPAHRSIEDRIKAARMARAALKAGVPQVIDGVDNAVTQSYGGHLEMIVVIDARGRILIQEQGYFKVTVGALEKLIGHILTGDRGYYPLEPGYAWVYRMNHDDSDQFMLTVTGRRKVGPVECIAREKIQDGKLHLIDYMAHDAEGLKFYRQYNPLGEDAFSAPQIIVKYPVRPRDQWVWTGEVKDLKLKRTFTHEGEEAVTVPAGTFWCARVSIESEASDGTRVHEQRWFAHGIGMVKVAATIVEKGKQEQLVEELKEFRFGP